VAPRGGYTGQYRVFLPVTRGAGDAAGLVVATVDVGALLASALAAGQFDGIAVTVSDADAAGAAVVYAHGVAALAASMVPPQSAVRGVFVGRNLTITVAAAASLVAAYEYARTVTTALMMSLIPVRRTAAAAAAAAAACAIMPVWPQRVAGGDCWLADWSRVHPSHPALLASQARAGGPQRGRRRVREVHACAHHAVHRARAAVCR
jgi:hypothetical protein